VRPATNRPWAAVVLVAAFGLGATLAGCTSGTPTSLPHGATSTTSSTPTTPTSAGGSAPTGTATTAPSEPTTTAVAPSTTTRSVATSVPADPQPSPEQATAALVLDWERGNRTAATQVATATAVATLFGRPYRGEVLNDRGCASPGPNPVICSWGPYALASPTNPLYEITVAVHRGGWYVVAVARETTG
jgi:hypothetical protein